MDATETFLIASSIYITALIITKIKKSKRRTVWTKSWHKRRTQANGNNILHMLDTELLKEDSGAYRNFLRMSSDQFEHLLSMVNPSIEKRDTIMRECVSAKNKLEVTLRFLATGESYRSLMYSTRIHESTISLFVPEVATVIFDVLKPELKTPSSSQEWKTIADDFEELWQFPRCLGALDGRHIKFRPPKSAGSYYFNYKSTHSVVLLALVDAHYKFIYINVGVNGRISDGGVFRESNLSKAIINNELNFPAAFPLPGRDLNVPYVIVADDAFPLQSRILKPYPQRQLNEQNRIFNYRLSRARRIVENAFGILANRFRILLNPINLAPNKVETITLACVALHNYLLKHNGISYVKSNEDEPCSLSKLQDPGPNRSTNSNLLIREEYKQYFCSPTGSVTWQNAAIAKHNM